METLNVAAKTDKTPPNAPPNPPESKAKDINNTTNDGEDVWLLLLLHLLAEIRPRLP